jgi:superfamily II DNA or RNA helicase
MVFVTDSSLPRVTEALVKLGLMADLFIGDEAHRNTAVRLADVKAFWAEEALTKLPAARRFYITATPRSNFDAADGRARTIISQDDAELFGPVAFDLPFDEAVTRGIVLPIAAYNFDTTDGELAKTLRRADLDQIWHGKRMDYNEIAAHLAIYKAVSVGLTPPEGTDEPYRPERIMVTFNRVSQAKAFVRHHAALMRALGIPGAKAWVYVAATPDGDRQVVRRCVRDLDHGGRPLSHAVIVQCGALTEGFDLPDLDMTLVADYGKSTIAIQQLIGRVTRLPVRSSKRWASVVTTDVNPGDLNEPPFYSVVRALTGQSESLRHYLLDDQRTDRSGQTATATATATATVRLGTLDGKPLPGDFTERLRLALVPTRHRDDWIPTFVDHLREFNLGLS